MKKFVFGMERNSKIFYKLMLSYGCAQPGMPKVPKIGNLLIFAISLERNGG